MVDLPIRSTVMMPFRPQFPGEGIDEYSFSSSPIRYFLHDETYAKRHASAFFFRRNGVVYLVTAAHCLSGVNAFSGKPLSTDGFEPWLIEVFPALKSGERIVRTPVRVRVRDVNPLWLVDPDAARLKTDVAAIPMPNSIDHQSIMCINHGEEQLAAFPGADCFVLGYPNPSFGDPYVPIWRRGSFAYEPSLPVDGKPVFLLDVFSSAGMSGSAIIQRWFGPAPRRIGGQLDVRLQRVVSSRLIGVYGGRVVDEAIGPIGYGWYANRIENIIDQQPDTALSHFSFPSASSEQATLVNVLGNIGVGMRNPFGSR